MREVGMMRRTLLVLPVLALALASCGNDDGAGVEAEVDLLDEVISRGIVTVATDPEYPPMSSYDEETETWEGFDVDVANEIAERLGVGIEFATPSWDVIVAGGWGDEWQLSVGSMGPTAERQEMLLFSTPYYYTPAVLAVHDTNTTITGPADLTGGTVGVCGGCTVYSEYVAGTLQLAGAPPFEFQIHDADVVFYEGIEGNALAIEDLAEGACDAILDNQPAVQRAIDAGDPYKVLEPPLFVEPLAVAMDKGAADPTSLAIEVSDIIEEMRADGTLAELSCKWFGADYSVADPSQADTC
jgi:polar amino acid transport system substrate-binding protein